MDKFEPDVCYSIHTESEIVKLEFSSQNGLCLRIVDIYTGDEQKALLTEPNLRQLQIAATYLLTKKMKPGTLVKMSDSLKTKLCL